MSISTEICGIIALTRSPLEARAQLTNPWIATISLLAGRLEERKLGRRTDYAKAIRYSTVLRHHRRARLSLLPHLRAFSRGAGLGHRARGRLPPGERMALAALGTDHGCHRQHRSRHTDPDRADPAGDGRLRAAGRERSGRNPAGSHERPFPV